MFNGIKKRLSEFPTGVWVPTYEKFLSPSVLQAIREAGINFIPSLSCNKHELDLIENAGLKCIVNDDRVTYANISTLTSIKEYVSEYAHLPQVIGVFVWDEPSPSMMKICGAVNGEINKSFPDLLGYINLHPSYSDVETQRDGLTYEEYLKAFVDLCKPQLLSFDHYPFMDYGITKDYFYNMQAVRDCCNNNNLEFWSFIQTCSFLNNVTPTKEQIFWHANTNLAYGAKGLLYFTYWTVIHDPLPNFGQALVDEIGAKTQRYYYVQDYNKYLSSIGDTLLKLKHEGVKFFGKNFGGRDTTNGFDVTDVDGGDVLVGFFTEGEDRYIYVVSLNPDNAQKLTIHVDGARDIRVKGADIQLYADKIEFNLNPGDGRLIKL